MSDLSHVRQAHSIDLPPRLWLRSGRSFRGTALRIYLGFVFIVVALLAGDESPLFWPLVGTGVVSFVALPFVAQMRLQPWEARVLRAGRDEAEGLLKELRESRWLQWFAPYGWSALQSARLHLRREDGRAALKALQDVARLSREASALHLLALARAEACLMAGEYREAHRVLREEGEEAKRDPRYPLTLGVSILLEGGGLRESLAALEKVESSLQSLPRYIAAKALADQRSGREEEAMRILEAWGEGTGEETDRIAEELIRRARKGAKGKHKKKEKKRGKKKASTPEVKVEAKRDEGRGDQGTPKRAAKEKKQSRKQRKRARREARREERATERAELRRKEEARRRAEEEKLREEQRARIDAVRNQENSGEEERLEGAPRVEENLPVDSPVAAPPVAAPPVAAPPVAAPPVAAPPVAAPPTLDLDAGWGDALAGLDLPAPNPANGKEKGEDEKE